MPIAIPDLNGDAPFDPNLLARIAGEILREIPQGLVGGGGSTAAPLSLVPPVSGIPHGGAASVPPAGTGIPPGGIPLGGYGAPPQIPPAVVPQELPQFAGISSPGIPSSGIPSSGIPSPRTPSIGTGADYYFLTDRQPDAALKPDPLSEAIPGQSGLSALLAPFASMPQSAPQSAALPVGTAPNYYFVSDTVPAPAQTPAQTPSQTPSQSTHPAFDPNVLRKDFPILSETVNGRPLVWLDNAATTQKPQAVIDRLSYFYTHENSNIHRAAHELAARSTDAYEKARDITRRFVGAASSDEIIFVRGTTEGINLIAQSWGRANIGAGDEIVITWLEHHANIVPWQMLCEQTGARLRVVPVDDRGQVRLDAYQALLNDRTKLVSFTQVSNALGTVTPARTMIGMAQRVGAKTLLDGAQSVSHMAVDVQALDCDFFVLSGHKVFGPTGIGAVYGKAEVLETMPAWQGGGNMIRDVTFERTEYHGAPARFEAGTGNIADAVGLGAALEYVERVGLANIARHEHDLIAYATRGLSDIPGLTIIGTAAEKAGVVSFVLDDIPPERVGKALNREGIAVRSGHHCAQPILRRFGVEATVRPSFALYNTFADIDALVSAVRRIQAGALSVD